MFNFLNLFSSKGSSSDDLKNNDYTDDSYDSSYYDSSLNDNGDSDYNLCENCGVEECLDGLIYCQYCMME